MKFLRHHLIALFLILSMGISVWPLSNAQAEDILAKEYFVKIAFLYNFARMVDWPDNTFSNNYDPINLCFIGVDPFHSALKSIRNKRVNDRAINIKRFIALEDTTACHILFISRTENKRVPDILNFVKDQPVLTVSELPQFAEQSGHIRFFINENKLKLEINYDAILQANLNISSRILALAKIVSTHPSSGETINHD